MNIVATFTLHVFALLMVTSIHHAQAAYALAHRCAGSYALDPAQEDLRTQMATLVCTKQGCSCESYTPLAQEVCRLLSLKKTLTEKDMFSLNSIIAQNTEVLIKKAPECTSTVFHLMLSCRPQFGCLHEDGAYLSNNINIVMLALIGDTKRPYSRQLLLAELTNAYFRTPFEVANEVANKIEALKPVKKTMEEQLEDAAIGAYWKRYNEEKKKRDKKRKQLKLQEKTSLV